MTKGRRIRRLVAGDTAWLWSTRHRHPGCRDEVFLRDEGSGAALRIVFDQSPGRITSGGFTDATGTVSASAGGHLNLHEPGVVRRLLDEALRRGPVPADGVVAEADGWPLFDAVAGD
ncbi:hypothetical protein [Streptomyces sp. NPDC058330]|uniref:hypothetical protein n=1 Tax=Streptomyces sp. NPDC058330 TaxID=3346449 RepID=UPI0036E11CC3